MQWAEQKSAAAKQREQKGQDKKVLEISKLF